jgi:hypothetical protein
MTGNRLWIFGAVVLSIAIIALGYFVGVVPKLAEADAASAQRQSTDQQNAATEISLAKLRGQYNELPQLTAQLAALQVAIPATPDTYSFAILLGSYAAQTGVTVSSVTASEAVAFDAPATPADPAAPAATTTATPPPADPAAPADAAAPATTTSTGPAAGQLYTVQVVITVKGSGANVLAFTRMVQEGPRLFLGSELTFSGDGGAASSTPASGAPQGEEGAEGGSLSGYLFVVPGAPAAPGTTPTPTPTPTPVPTPAPTTTGIPTSPTSTPAP